MWSDGQYLGLLVEMIFVRPLNAPGVDPQGLALLGLQVFPVGVAQPWTPDWDPILKGGAAGGLVGQGEGVPILSPASAGEGF